MSLRGNEEIRSFIDKLTTSTDVANYVELPMIAVMGETSSGKSSLLSSISGVELPSASELTTRCPIMLQMKRAEKQHATVCVQWKETPKGKSKESIQFVAKVVTEKDWATLPGCISEAQKHIIGLTGKEVARDIVQVKVEGPHCEDLTLVDLPGIVRTRGKGEGETIVDDIKSLIEEYLQNKRCVILAVVPANVDFHNSQIMADAQKVDPETIRTIPVITKPDLIDKGAEKDVKDLLLGRKTDKFDMGFHMVKGRGQHDLSAGKSITEGLADELKFFQSFKPWSEISQRDMFGIEPLRRKLGKLQMDLIRKTLPDIMLEIKEKLESGQADLADLGNIHKSLVEKKMFYHEVRDEVVFYVEATLSGTHPRGHKRLSEPPLSAHFIEKCKRFKDSLYNGKLANISSLSKSAAVLALVGKQSFRGIIVGGDEEGGYFVDYDDRRTTNRGEFIYQWQISDATMSEAETTWAYPSEPTYLCISNGNGTCDILKPIAATKLRRDPQWLLPLITEHRPDELPIFMNKEVFEKLVNDYIDEDWVELCKQLVKDAKSTLLTATEKALDRSSKLKRYSALRVFLQSLIHSQVATSTKEVEGKVNHLIEKERTPYTQNHYLFENLSKKRFESLKEELLVALGVSTNGPSHNVTTQSIGTIIDGIFDKNQRKSIEEHMAEDMQHALDSYGKLAMKRVMDNVPMQCWDVIRAFPREELESVLLSVSDDDLDRMICYSPEQQMKYEELKQKCKAMEDGLALLKSLW